MRVDISGEAEGSVQQGPVGVAFGALSVEVESLGHQPFSNRSADYTPRTPSKSLLLETCPGEVEERWLAVVERVTSEVMNLRASNSFPRRVKLSCGQRELLDNPSVCFVFFGALLALRSLVVQVTYGGCAFTDGNESDRSTTAAARRPVGIFRLLPVPLP
jgi:hypothetical protein